jgi:hypothetical protein
MQSIHTFENINRKTEDIVIFRADFSPKYNNVLPGKQHKSDFKYVQAKTMPK